MTPGITSLPYLIASDSLLPRASLLADGYYDDSQCSVREVTCHLWNHEVELDITDYTFDDQSRDAFIDIYFDEINEYFPICDLEDRALPNIRCIAGAVGAAWKGNDHLVSAMERDVSDTLAAASESASDGP
jgi:hypothetical protein